MDEEAGADQQQHGNGDLEHDEPFVRRRPETVPPALRPPEPIARASSIRVERNADASPVSTPGVIAVVAMNPNTRQSTR